MPQRPRSVERAHSQWTQNIDALANALNRTGSRAVMRAHLGKPVHAKPICS